jgi:hypothetical protein
MRGLYFECERGISGDMTVAALLDLGADRSALDRMLKSLPLTGFSTCISRVSKAGLDMCDFAVELEEENHDHDMDYLYGQEHGHEHNAAGHGKILHPVDVKPEGTHKLADGQCGGKLGELCRLHPE